MALSSTVCLRIDMASLGQILSKTFFWSYERGTWQYDVAVILILVFVLATPRSWFHDKPESGGPAAPVTTAMASVRIRHPSGSESASTPNWSSRAPSSTM